MNISLQEITSTYESRKFRFNVDFKIIYFAVYV